MLHRVVEGTGPRVVLVHGFTQTLASWAPVTADLALDHEVVRVDAPGHGDSGDVRTDLSDGAKLLADAGGRATYVGYSMGGRLALRLALDRPDLVERLVLIGATAGIDDARQRADRRTSDEVLARSIESDGVDAFLDRWLALPLFASLSPTVEDLATRHANTAAGLASSLRLAGTATMDPPWWPELRRIDAPTLILAGERDAKFTTIAHRLVEAIGKNATSETVPASTHAAHLQHPTQVAAKIRELVAARPNPGLR